MPLQKYKATFSIWWAKISKKVIEKSIGLNDLIFFNTFVEIQHY